MPVSPLARFVIDAGSHLEHVWIGASMFEGGRTTLEGSEMVLAHIGVVRPMAVDQLCRRQSQGVRLRLIRAVWARICRSFCRLARICSLCIHDCEVEPLPRAHVV